MITTEGIFSNIQMTIPSQSMDGSFWSSIVHLYARFWRYIIIMSTPN